ncbi:DUF2515 family protein [Cohnella rhizosphaerae]|uniref:DUF2515 domain-containing protein n=1 Tax=Cohnella rhizosphaerae TaxID=1457232 RepID=A0A9X4QXF9_9BACL|nr:DUF2515 family protein [Cohnella rhizosphaerae]MDG0814543.1 DUF2515 domain-containing protein [Cohnella rhizosphaerae]
MAIKGAALLESLRLARPRSSLRLPKGIAGWAESELSEEINRGWRGASSHLDSSNAALVACIREETETHNRNNVTRTAAYMEMYKAFPELHWALLAHLVSRNGGWNMTDLQGAWLPKLLKHKDRATLFGMLESCNALIFRDAYPQLRLYGESRRTGRSRFALLPAFGVSAFMRPFWERFWIERDPTALTVALIVNEQHVIERRVVQDPAYKDTVLASAAFKGMRPLQLQQVIVPLGGVRIARLPPGTSGTERGDGPDGGDEPADTALAGRVLESFANVDERIAFGKSLYAMLFAYPKVLGGALAFAETVSHTGSRADYWPERFTALEGHGERHGEALGSHRPAWYSPKLADAWPDRPLGSVREGDWLADLNVLKHFRSLRAPIAFVMTHEHAFGERKLQAAALALESLKRRASRP